jgi:hypothetical protein
MIVVRAAVQLGTMSRSVADVEEDLDVGTRPIELEHLLQAADHVLSLVIASYQLNALDELRGLVCRAREGKDLEAVGSI